jgi:hypothetical protein
VVCSHVCVHALVEVVQPIDHSGVVLVCTVGVEQLMAHL